MYFEITGPKYKESPSVCKEKGGLHSTRLPHIQKVQRMGPSTQAVYMKWDLDCVPHYQLERQRRKEVTDLLSNRSIPLESFDHTKSIIVEDDIAIFNVHTPEFDRFAKLNYDRLNFESVLQRVLNSESSDASERGNIALSVGFASLNQKHSGTKGVATPQVVAATDPFLVEQMCIMSDLISSLSESLPSKPPIFQDDPLRNTEFSGSLPKRYGLNTDSFRNIVEAATFAVTKVAVGNDGHSNTFGCHVDQFNDRLRNWNVVVCAYKYVWYVGQLYRVAIICYSRAAVWHHYIRLNAFEILRRNLRKYILHLQGVRSGKYSAITCLSIGKTIYRLPHLNKCAFYSSFSSCLRKLLIKFVKLRCFAKCSELLLPMSWTPSP